MVRAPLSLALGHSRRRTRSSLPSCVHRKSPTVDVTDAGLAAMPSVGVQWGGALGAPGGSLAPPPAPVACIDPAVEGIVQHQHLQRATPHVPRATADTRLAPKTQRWACAPRPRLGRAPEPVDSRVEVGASLEPTTSSTPADPSPGIRGAALLSAAVLPAVPPLPEKLPAPVPLNTHGLGVAANFRGDMPNERGRGGFAAALFSLLEQSELATTHIHAVRSSEADGSANAEQQFDRWSLNRLPGCTDVLLRFINSGFTDILGLKPFMSWRSLARCLGDSREYLSHRHWQCLELKGGGRMASTVHPWQSYRTTAGHFDSLANELVEWLLWCHAEAPKMATKTGPKKSGPKKSKLAVLAEHRAKKLGAGAPVCVSAEAINGLVKNAWDAAYTHVDSVGLDAKGEPPAGASTSSPAKRKGSTEQNDSRVARPTKKSLLTAAALVVGAYVVARHRGWHVDHAASDVGGFHRPSDASSSAADGVVATGFIEVGTIEQVEIGLRFRRTVSFQGSFVDPVIIGGIPSSSANSRGNGAVTRLHGLSLQSKTCEIFLDVPRSNGHPCGRFRNAPETVSWMVVEAGAWQSTSQVQRNSTGAGVALTHGAIEAGSGVYGLCSGGPLCTVANGCDTCGLMTGFEWRNVQFEIPHPDPIVLTQVQTYHGHDWVTQRLRRVSPDGFQVRQEEDGTDGSHLSEMLGWVAFSNGAGWFDVRQQRMLDYHAIRTSQSLTSEPYTISFGGEFSHTPALFGSLQTHTGGDPSHLRYSATGVAACTAFVEEEQCSDQEVNHAAAERAGIVAIKPGLAKLQPQAKPLQTSLRGLMEAGSVAVSQVLDSDGNLAQYTFQTQSSQFENPVVFLGALKYQQDARGSDRQKQARIRSVRTIPQKEQCPRDDVDRLVARAGFSCQEVAAMVGCSADSDLNQAAPDLFPRHTSLALVCPRTCNACGTTIVSFVIDSPRGHRATGGEPDAACAAVSHLAGEHAGTVSWLVAEAGTWAGGSQVGPQGTTDRWAKGKVHVRSSTLGICAGGPLCTREHGCASCDLAQSFRWRHVQFEDSRFAAIPLVMSQLQTAHGARWVALRQSAVTPVGFRIRMVGDGVARGHNTERIGYMALSQGHGNLHGLGYEATIHRNLVCMLGPSTHSDVCRLCTDDPRCVVQCAVCVYVSPPGFGARNTVADTVPHSWAHAIFRAGPNHL